MTATLAVPTTARMPQKRELAHSEVHQCDHAINTMTNNRQVAKVAIVDVELLEDAADEVAVMTGIPRLA